MSFSNLLRLITPPIFIKLFKIFKTENSKHLITGPYKTWKEATINTVGYADERITKKLLHSANSVNKGDALFQRDGMLLKEIEYNWPTLCALLVAQANSTANHVLDVGGIWSNHFTKFKLLAHYAWGQGNKVFNT